MASPEQYDARTSARDDLLGLVLTPDEVAQMRTRNRLEHHAAVLERWGRDNVPDTFAGLHIAAAADGGGAIVKVLFADDPELYREELTELLPEELRGRLVLERVAHSLNDLLAREREVDAALRRLVREGFEYNVTAADVVANRVTVFVPRLTDQLRAALRRMVGDHMIGFVEEGGRAEPVGVLKDQPLIYALVAGGQYIHNNSAACTSAFAAHGYYGPFMLTAGHCFGINQTTYQGNAVLGKVAAINFSGNQDSLAVSTYGYRNQAGRFHRNADDMWSPIHWAIGLEADPIGAIVCSAGATTTGLDGYQNPSGRCGAITQKYAAISYVPAGTASFRLANYWSNPGDSGGTIYWDTIYGVGGVGINSGRTGAGTGIFTHLPYALNAWGLTLDAPG